MKMFALLVKKSKIESVNFKLQQIIKFWLKEKQVDGLRVDSLKYLYEDAHLQDEPIKNDRYVDSNVSSIN